MAKKFEFEKLSPTKLKARRKEAIAWFADKIKQSGKKTIDPQDVMSGRKGLTTPLIGQMVFFEYHAKHEKTLPYWDEFPLAFLLDVTDDSFLSLNVHYLPPYLRQILVNRLLDTISDNNFDHRSKAKINYGILKGVSKFKIAQPALKRHLFSQLRSKVVRIQPLEWDMAIYLDLESWVGASARKVWSDSEKMIR